MSKRNKYLPRKENRTKTDYAKLERFFAKITERTMRENAIRDAVAVNEAKRNAIAEAQRAKSIKAAKVKAEKTAKAKSAKANTAKAETAKASNAKAETAKASNAFASFLTSGMSRREVKRAVKLYSPERKTDFSAKGKLEALGLNIKYSARSVAKSARKYAKPAKYAAGFAALVVALFLLSSVSFGYAVSLDGNYLGIVDNIEEVNAALDTLQAEYKRLYNVDDLYFERAISYRPALTLFKGGVMSENEIIQRADSFGLDLYYTGAAVTLDGVEVLWMNSSEDAQSAIDSFMANYSANTDETYEVLEVVESGFSQKLEVKPATVQSAYITTVRQAVNFLNSLTTNEQTEIPIAGAHDTSPGKLATAMVFRVGTSSANDTRFIPLLKVVTVKEVKYEASLPFETKQTESSAYYITQNVLVQEGVEGVKRVHSIVTYENNVKIGEEILDETVLTASTPAIYCKGTRTLPTNMGTFVIPASGSVSAIDKSGSHKGGKAVDIANGRGGDIFAAASGTVTFAGAWGTYGNAVMIKHTNGYSTLYGHLETIYVTVGQSVSQGSTIGFMGDTGRSTGTHLHLEIRTPDNEKDYILAWFPGLTLGKRVSALSDGM
ncbi:MAG: peptidoglycan DD-metalloendopeptidase family protein [Eubacteriaceae bacterium]|nr:peptidoglycan DD-metalloendopeptidase family protein [Eubacteriaceae bacterium]